MNTINPFTLAADYLLEHGWTRGRMRDSVSGKVCCLGALLFANQFRPQVELERLADWLAKFVVNQKLGGDPFMTAGFMAIVPRWNDMYAADKEEVVQLLRDAAEAWDLELDLQTPVTRPAPRPWVSFDDHAILMQLQTFTITSPKVMDAAWLKDPSTHLMPVG